jgi:carbamoyl-phosphate synthase small subunit
MAERGLEVHVVPSTITFGELEALKPDGVFFSNGPGDPAAAQGQVELLRAVLAAGIPYLSICFGNQLFGRTLGFGTFKLGYRHRGINQPVMDLTTRKVEVTAHNHGFAVEAKPGKRHQTPYRTAEVSHICLSDDVVEGLWLCATRGSGDLGQLQPGDDHDRYRVHDRSRVRRRSLQASDSSRVST